jgi:hypothetical protein
MHPTADTLPLINLNRLGRRVMPGVRCLPVWRQGRVSMLYYRKYKYDFLDQVLTEAEFHRLKSYVQTNPNTYPFPQASFSQYKKELIAELKDIYTGEITTDLKQSLIGLIVSVSIFFAVYLVSKAVGFYHPDISWLLGIITFLLVLKFMFLPIGVLISLAGFTGYFNTKKRYHKGLYDVTRSCPDYESYLSRYRKSWKPALPRTIT